MAKEQKSFYPTLQDKEQHWVLIDAEGQVLGRLASVIAKHLMGKMTPSYTPSVDMGDFVVVINTDKMSVTGQKAKQKMYYRHSGYPGGLKKRLYSDWFAKDPSAVLYEAVKGMLPKNRLGRQMLKKLKCCVGTQHPYQAQKPEPVTI